jgi:hypothetical protein
MAIDMVRVEDEDKEEHFIPFDRAVRGTAVMSPRSTFFLLLTVLLAVAAFAAPVARAQEATPAAEGALLVVSDADLAATGEVVLGFLRHTYAPGAGQTVSTGSGPLLLWIESGALTVEAVQGGAAMVLGNGAGAASRAMEVAAEPGVTFGAGQALLLPAASEATLRNTGAEPTQTLHLVSGVDLTLAPEEGVSEVVIARREVAIPSTATLALERDEIPPGESLAERPDAVELVVAPLDRAQIFVLSRNNFNRGSTPMPVYVMTITPGEGGVATPTT